jgi:hypothetical protein
MKWTIAVIMTLLGALAYGQSNPISPGTSANKSVGLSGSTAPTSSNLVAGLRGDTVNGGNTMVPLRVGGSDELLVGIVADNIVAPLDAGLLDASLIEGSTGNCLQVVAGLTRSTKKIRVHSTTGIYVGVYTGPPGSEAFVDSFGPGADYDFAAKVPAGTRVCLKSLELTGGTTGDLLFMDFLE